MRSWTRAHYAHGYEIIESETERRVSLANDADAALICAAPELLAACRAAIKVLDQFCGDVNWIAEDGQTADAVRAAIAKAEGR